MRPAFLTAAEQLSLVDRIREGDGIAEEEVVRLFGERIRLMALARTRDRDAARDLTQEVLLGVLSALRRGQIREAEKLGAFIQGAARNIINGYLRSRSHDPAHEPLSSEDVVCHVDHEEEFELSQRKGVVRRALSRLDLTDRRILLMTLIDGLKPGEIGYALGLTAEVVRARKSRAVKKVIERVQRLLGN
jgi:RNA polymerase sigma factor (sigma-70 family)